jgi:hypothetical protein
MAPTNLIEAPAFPRRWTFIANGCDASESAVFKLSGPVSYNGIDNELPYAMFSNEGSNFYSIDHPNYGTGGSFPNGTYTLTVDLRSANGAGGPFPKNRAAAGSLLATRSLQFTVVSPAGARLADSWQSIADRPEFARVLPNPVSQTMQLLINEAKGQSLNVSLVDMSGRALLQRVFVPETNAHQEAIEVSHLTNGMYFLQITGGDKQTTLKVIKVN